MTYPPCLLCGSEFLGNVGDICLDCEDKLSRVPSVIALREQVAALEIHNVELERLQKGNERLQEELEAMACQLGAQDAELTSLRAILSRVEDVEGMAKVIENEGGYRMTETSQESRMRWCRAVRDYIKGEG